jgi:hypothetical protein
VVISDCRHLICVLVLRHFDLPPSNRTTACWLWTGGAGCSVFLNAAYTAVAMNIFFAIPTIISGIIAYALVRMLNEEVRFS